MMLRITAAFACVCAPLAVRRMERKEKARRARARIILRERIEQVREPRLEARANDYHRKLAAMQKADFTSVPEDLLNVDRDMLICCGAYYLPAEEPSTTLESLEPGNPA